MPLSAFSTGTSFSVTFLNWYSLFVQLLIWLNFRRFSNAVIAEKLVISCDFPGLKRIGGQDSARTLLEELTALPPMPMAGFKEGKEWEKGRNGRKKEREDPHHIWKETDAYIKINVKKLPV